MLFWRCSDIMAHFCQLNNIFYDDTLGCDVVLLFVFTVGSEWLLVSHRPGNPAPLQAHWSHLKTKPNIIFPHISAKTTGDS